MVLGPFRLQILDFVIKTAPRRFRKEEIAKKNVDRTQGDHFSRKLDLKVLVRRACAAGVFLNRNFAATNDCWPKTLMAQWPSRVWSCSELLRGACQVVDMGGAPAADSEVVAMKRQLMSETSSLGAAEIAALLEDH